jgi:hypothetical protein
VIGRGPWFRSHINFKGMNDLLSPILYVMEGREAESFWCFVSFMDRGSLLSTAFAFPRLMKCYVSGAIFWKRPNLYAKSIEGSEFITSTRLNVWGRIVF